MKLETLKKKLEAAGLDVTEQKRITVNGIVNALRVAHNYDGMYMTDDARGKRDLATRIARAAGFRPDRFKTATIIYEM